MKIIKSTPIKIWKNSHKCLMFLFCNIHYVLKRNIDNYLKCTLSMDINSSDPNEESGMYFFKLEAYAVPLSICIDWSGEAQWKQSRSYTRGRTWHHERCLFGGWQKNERCGNLKVNIYRSSILAFKNVYDVYAEKTCVHKVTAGTENHCTECLIFPISNKKVIEDKVCRS